MQIIESIQRVARRKALAQNGQAVKMSDRSPRQASLQMMADMINNAPRQRAMRALASSLPPGQAPVQRTINARTGESYANAAALPVAAQGVPLLAGLAGAAGVALVQSAAALNLRANGTLIPVLRPRRHVIGEQHDDSHFNEAVAAWGWGAAKMEEGFQVSQSVVDPYTQGWLHPGFFNSRAKVGTLPLEDVHARMLQDIAAYRSRVHLLQLAASGVSPDVAMNRLTAADKIQYNQIRALAEDEKGNLLVRLKGYETSCGAVLEQDAGQDTPAQAQLRIMATAMNGRWDGLRASMTSVASSPWNIVMRDSGDYAVATRLTLRAQGAATLIGELVALAGHVVAVMNAEANNPAAAAAAANTALQHVTAGTGGNAFAQVSPLRELFMTQKITAMPAPGLVGTGQQHVLSMGVANVIPNAEYHTNYGDFTAAIQMKSHAGPVLQAQWRNDTGTVNTPADLERVTRVPHNIDPGSEADQSLASATEFLVAPAELLAQQAASLAVPALPPGRHVVGESAHGAPEWPNATASWPYVPKMRERLKTYEKPDENTIAAADAAVETRMRQGSNDLALEGHNEYAVAALTLVQQFLKGYDQFHERSRPEDVQEKADWFALLYDRAREAYIVSSRLQRIGEGMIEINGRSPRQEQYLQMAFAIFNSPGYEVLGKIAEDTATGYVTKLGGWTDKLFFKSIYKIQALVNDVVPRIVAIDNFQNMQPVTALNQGLHRNEANWKLNVIASIAATGNVRELEMARRISAGPSPLLVQVGAAHIAGLRTIGVPESLYDNEFNFEMATQKNTFNLAALPLAPPAADEAEPVLAPVLATPPAADEAAPVLEPVLATPPSTSAGDGPKDQVLD